MIVPKYWSESKTQLKIEKRQFTIRRFGWSNESETAAKTHADERLKEAVETLKREGDVRRFDPRTPYNGADGVPIREEVVSTHSDVVISRNSYGALCLNTPDVLFADVDFQSSASCKVVFVVFAVLCAISIAASLTLSSGMFIAPALVVAALLSSPLANLITKMIFGGPEKRALTRFTRISEENPELNMRIYRTPMGFRILLMNDTYSPTNANTIALLEKFDSDKVYVQMCKNQNCFRARVSPKPWRIGLERLRAGYGVWPIAPQYMDTRRRWVSEYENASIQYASCHFVSQLGSNLVSSKADMVRRLHDDLCQADRHDLDAA